MYTNLASTDYSHHNNDLGSCLNKRALRVLRLIGVALLREPGRRREVKINQLIPHETRCRVRPGSDRNVGEWSFRLLRGGTEVKVCSPRPTRRRVARQAARSGPVGSCSEWREFALPEFSLVIKRFRCLCGRRSYLIDVCAPEDLCQGLARAISAQGYFRPALLKAAWAELVWRWSGGGESREQSPPMDSELVN
jgi:hypothetical protein